MSAFETFKRNRTKSNQDKAESEILASLKDCEYSEQEYNDFARSIDVSKLQEELDNDFYNPNLMQLLRCVFKHFSESGVKQEGLDVPTPGSLSNLISEAKRVGTESVFGIVFLTGIKGVKGKLIVKVSRKKKEEDDLVHEAFVGIVGTNQMRRYVPNFAYVIGALKCNAPTVEPDKKVKDLCGRGGNLVNYVLYEAIDGNNLRKICKDCTPEQFTSLYSQLVFTTLIGYEKIDWTDYDLHYENVIGKPLRKTVYIPYNSKNYSLYVKADTIATIIDLGASYIKYKGVGFGTYDWPQPAYVLSDQPRPIHDVFKVLCFSLVEMVDQKNMRCFNKAVKLLKFFTQKYPAQVRNLFGTSIIDEKTIMSKYAADVVYSFPLIHGIRDPSIHEFVDFLMTDISTKRLLEDVVVDEVPEGQEVFGCSKSVCLSGKGILESLLQQGNYIEFEDIEDMHSKLIQVRDEKTEGKLLKQAKKQFPKIEQTTIGEMKRFRREAKRELETIEDYTASNDLTYILDNAEGLKRAAEFIYEFQERQHMLSIVYEYLKQFADYKGKEPQKVDIKRLLKRFISERDKFISIFDEIDQTDITPSMRAKIDKIEEATYRVVD
jgi:hypothetical protein